MKTPIPLPYHRVLNALFLTGCSMTKWKLFSTLEDSNVKKVSWIIWQRVKIPFNVSDCIFKHIHVSIATNPNGKIMMHWGTALHNVQYCWIHTYQSDSCVYPPSFNYIVQEPKELRRHASKLCVLQSNINCWTILWMNSVQFVLPYLSELYKIKNGEVRDISLRRDWRK